MRFVYRLPGIFHNLVYYLTGYAVGRIYNGETGETVGYAWVRPEIIRK